MKTNVRICMAWVALLLGSLPLLAQNINQRSLDIRYIDDATFPASKRNLSPHKANRPIRSVAPTPPAHVITRPETDTRARISAATVETFNYSGAIVLWKVPAGVTSITIEALGAEGGYSDMSGFRPGKGASITGTVAVTPGAQLKILVGQQGTENGGGGGTYITDNANNPLIVAGGGGGSGNSNDSPNKEGQAGTSGGAGRTQGHSGGTNGNGGGQDGTAGLVMGSGGGLQTNGGNSNRPSYNGGLAFVNGGDGGTAANGANGGFGGGGAGSFFVSGGGGGGYSGGGGAGFVSGTGGVGGGGGSFNGGTNGTNTAGVNSGNGLVNITYELCTPSTASIGGNNGPVCAGGDATFSVSGTSGATLTYTLTGQSGNQTLALNGNNQTITASAATSNAMLTLVSVTKEGCSQSLSATSTVTVNALPTASIGGNNGPVCAGGNAIFTVSGSSGATLTYTLTGLSGNQTVALNGNNQTITVSGATANATLTLVSVADASCSQNLSATSTVSVNALPTASIGGNNGPICAGGDATFTVSGTSGATLTCTLTGLSGNQTVALNGNNQTITVSGATANATLTLLSVTKEGCSQNLSATSTVTVNALPTASIEGNNGPVCAGGDATFSVSGTSGSTLTYTLTGQSGNQTLALNGNNQTITASGATANAILTLVSVANSNCSQILTGTSTVTVNALPTASIGGNNGPVCAGGDATFSVSGTSGATLTYTLTGQSGNQTLLLNGGSQTITASGATANAILTLVSVGNANCSQILTGTSTVTVNALPTASIGGNNGPICAGSDATFTVSGTSGATLTYTLTGQSGNQTLLLNGGNQTITASGATANAMLTLVSVAKANCSQNLSGTSTVTVNALPTASIAGNNGPICAGGDATFTVSGTSGATLTYTLTGQSGNQTLALNGNNQTITASGATANAILTLVSVGNANCSQNLTGSSTVTVNPLPTASIGGNNGPVCAGGDATFTVSGTSGATLTYTLTGQSGNQTLALNGGSQTITASGATSNATLTLVSVANSNCSQNLTGTSTVTVNPLPSMNAGPDQSVILGFGSNCTNLTATPSGGSGNGYNYTWNPGNLSGQTVNVCPQQTTTYTVTLTDGNGCQATDQVVVRVQDVRCGPANKNQNVQICYYGVTQCVSEKIAKNYLKLGATLGPCGSASTRIGYEPETTGLPLALSLKAYPNPVQDAVTVEVLSPAAGTATMEVLDITGRARQSSQQHLVQGLNEVELRLGTLPAGIYLIRAVDALGQQAVVRISKK